MIIPLMFDSQTFCIICVVYNRHINIWNVYMSVLQLWKIYLFTWLPLADVQILSLVWLRPLTAIFLRDCQHFHTPEYFTKSDQFYKHFRRRSFFWHIFETLFIKIVAVFFNLCIFSRINQPSFQSMEEYICHDHRGLCVVLLQPKNCKP